MDASFGNRLRSQREQQDVPLSVIAGRTKIKLSLLEALERGDVSHWPTGIFRRSFVRSYAQAIGLDPDAVLKEFLERYPEPTTEDVTAALAAAHDGRRPPTRFGAFLASLGVIPAARVPAPTARPTAAAAPAASWSSEPAPDAEPVETDVPAFDAQDEPVLSERGYFAQHELPMALEMAEAHDLSLGDRMGEQAMEMLPETMPEPMAVAAFERLQPRHEPAPLSGDRELSAFAELCSRLACVLQPREVTSVLEDAARMLRAAGVILWMWDPATRTLRHVLAHGYSSDVLDRLPSVCCDTDNAIADAFRTGDTRVVKSSGQEKGAVVVPIVTPGGCTGVLALELQDRGEERECVRAFARILAAQLAMLFGMPPLAEAVGV